MTTASLNSLFYGGEGGKTFSHDESLPSLPVPSLQQTLNKYLESVRPHLTDLEYENTETVVRQFERNEGRLLQNKLLHIAKEKRNWLEKWWEENGYLRLRMPTAPFMNFAGPGPYLEHYWPPKEGEETYLFRAAMSTYYVLKYWQLLRKETLKPDMTGKKDALAMNTYHRIFSTCKIPGIEQDTLRVSFKTESEGTAPTHIAVVYKRRFFVLTVIDATGEPLNVAELIEQLEFIKHKCDGEVEGPGVGALTADNRTTWAENRQYLQSLSYQNAKNLDLIEQSIFLLTLDDAHAPTFSKIMKEGLAGDCGNRWFDKSLCYIIFQDGTVGSNCDHMPFDAMTLVSLTYFVDLNITDQKGKWTGPTSIRPMSRPFELVFTLDARLHKNIKDAMVLYKNAADNLEALNPAFNHYGKKYIRSEKLYPDSMVQVALQCAYYRLYKRPAATYETATTRKYYHGRTETVRSCTMEALNWSQSMLDPSVSDHIKLKLMRSAIQKQNTLMTEACDNQGCDRHLLGLYILAQQEGLPVPEIYNDKAWTKSGGGGNYILSTSYVGSTTIGGGVAPMCTNGYGVFYRILDNRIVFFISTWVSDEETSAVDIFRSITQTLLDMKELLSTTKDSNL